MTGFSVTVRPDRHADTQTDTRTDDDKNNNLLRQHGWCARGNKWPYARERVDRHFRPWVHVSNLTE